MVKGTDLRIWPKGGKKYRDVDVLIDHVPKSSSCFNVIISKPSCNTILPPFPSLATVMQMFVCFFPWEAYVHMLFSLEFKVEKLLQNINTIPTSTPPPDTYLPREVKKKIEKVTHYYNSQLLQRPNMHSAFKLNKLLSHKALRPVQEFKLCCREIVPMSMWLINPSERIRGTFPEQLCHGLTRLSPSSIF